MTVDLKHLRELEAKASKTYDPIIAESECKICMAREEFITLSKQGISELEAYREMAEEVRGMNMAFSPDPQIQDNDALWKEKRDAILSKLDERLKGV